MNICRRVLAAWMAAFFIPVLNSTVRAQPEWFVLRTEGRQILVEAVEEAYGVELSRGGSRAAGTARTGDQLSDGRTFVLMGDLNTDGAISIADLVLAVQGTRQNIGALSVAAGDINGSGAIDIADLAGIAGMLGSASAKPLAELPPFPLSFFRGQVSAMIREVNAYRMSRGLPPLEQRTDMNVFCQKRAEEQLTYPGWELSHKRPDGKDFWDGAPYPPSGEVLAHCWTLPETGAYMNAAEGAVDQWIHSPGHERILSNPTAAFIGAGIACGRGPDGLWWWKACVQIAHEQ